ncbi:MAG: YifB family Mg chelatase-like AAA ATPase [Spirochaetales bacterium]
MQIVSYAPGGYRGTVVTVEVDCRTGIPGLEIVGLPASEVKEARERARVAIRNSGFAFPTKRILVNLAPADVQKSGNGFDLAIAVAVLAASDQLPTISPRVLILGELRLSGHVAPVRGVLAAVAEAADTGVRYAVVPQQNLAEAQAVPGAIVAGISTLSDIGQLCISIARGTLRAVAPAACPTPTERGAPTTGPLSDFSELHGCGPLRRVLEIAAAGGHHLLVVGPPGAGKSAAVNLYPTIQSRLTEREAIETTRLHSLAGELPSHVGVLTYRPFRSPHPQSSPEGLLGGGNPVRPGDVALAHHGTLFLDEGLEFRRPVLQGLREPMERRQIRLSRAGNRYWFPADFQLIMATNPCPCGMLGRQDRICLCGVREVERYWKRLGGPLIDRIDLRLSVTAERLVTGGGETSGEIRSRVIRARAIAYRRNGDRTNAKLSGREAADALGLPPSLQALLRQVTSAFGLSSRAIVSVLRLTRTIADLDGSENAGEEHLLEAVSYRRHGEDRPLWDPPG